MNLYLLTNLTPLDWDTYRNMVVIAPNEQEAIKIRPYATCGKEAFPLEKEFIEVLFLGIASPDLKQGVIVSEYNAG